LLEPDELAEEPPIQRLRRPFTRTLQTAIDTGLARLKAEAERRTTGGTPSPTDEPSGRKK
jgi:hypothetical protein